MSMRLFVASTINGGGLSSSRVGLFEGGAQAFCIYMRIDLSGGDVRMPEHLFDAHDFGTVFEQVRGKTVAQHVRARLALPADLAQ